MSFCLRFCNVSGALEGGSVMEMFPLGLTTPQSLAALWLALGLCVNLYTLQKELPI